MFDAVQKDGGDSLIGIQLVSDAMPSYGANSVVDSPMGAVMVWFTMGADVTMVSFQFISPMGANVPLMSL